MAPVLGGAEALESSAAKHVSWALKAAGTILVIALGIVFVVWLFKALYLVSTGLLRADDGHPLLGPCLAICTSWLTLLMFAITPGSGAPSGMPASIARATLYGGPISVTVISIWTLVHVARRYQGLDPFRGGPFGARTAAAEPAPTGSTVTVPVPAVPMPPVDTPSVDPV